MEAVREGSGWSPGVVTAFFPAAMAAAAAAVADCASGMSSEEGAECAIARFRGVEGLLALKQAAEKI
jgi:hypothetical protein